MEMSEYKRERKNLRVHENRYEKILQKDSGCKLEAFLLRHVLSLCLEDSINILK